MLPRDRVERALRREPVDVVPFTIYESKIPQCQAERELRNRGLCIVKRDVPAYLVHRPQVKVTQQVTWEGERRMVRTHYDTPVGSVETLGEDVGFTTWYHQHMFGSPDDYRVLRFLIKDEQYEPNYAALARAQSDFGGDGIFRASFGLEPLQALISGTMMGMEDFCLEWMDRRDEILRLYGLLVAKRRLLYPIVAQSPALIANYGGNVVPAIIGPANFCAYYVPHYDEAAEVMHRHGKLIGCHFDADTRLIAEAIGHTALDYIEAFTPSPDTDMTLSEARAAWPDKVLWLNFPSSAHLRSDGEVEDVTVALLDELDSPQGVIMGITEDIPEHRWRDSCRAIVAGLERHVRDHAHLYAAGCSTRTRRPE